MADTGEVKIHAPTTRKIFGTGNTHSGENSAAGHLCFKKPNEQNLSREDHTKRYSFQVTQTVHGITGVYHYRRDPPG